MIKSLFFSIIIPTLNEEKYISLLLSDISHQSYRNFETIVVDGNSDDSTLKQAKKFQVQCNLHSISVDTRNVSFQRNYGATKAQGKWLLFLDADDRIPSYFLQGLLYQIEKEKQTDVFTCWMDVSAYPTNDKPLIQINNLGLEMYARLKPMASGGMIGARRLVLKKIKFDESARYSEDHLFILESIKKGFAFKVFREPRYVSSLRRLKKEGTLKFMRSFAQMHLQYLADGKIPGLRPDYSMAGGSMYSQPTQLQISWYQQISHKFTSLSLRQKQYLEIILKIFEF